MNSAKEFREFALECARHAAATNDERLRKSLLEMSKLWMQAALETERSIALVQDEPPLVSDR